MTTFPSSPPLSAGHVVMLVHDTKISTTILLLSAGILFLLFPASIVSTDTTTPYEAFRYRQAIPALCPTTEMFYELVIALMTELSTRQIVRRDSCDSRELRTPLNVPPRVLAIASNQSNQRFPARVPKLSNATSWRLSPPGFSWTCRIFS